MDDRSMVLAQFLSITGLEDDTRALQLLEQNDWDNERAVQAFFAGGGDAPERSDDEDAQMPHAPTPVRPAPQVGEDPVVQAMERSADLAIAREMEEALAASAAAMYGGPVPGGPSAPAAAMVDPMFDGHDETEEQIMAAALAASIKETKMDPDQLLEEALQASIREHEAASGAVRDVRDKSPVRVPVVSRGPPPPVSPDFSLIYGRGVASDVGRGAFLGHRAQDIPDIDIPHDELARQEELFQRAERTKVSTPLRAERELRFEQDIAYQQSLAEDREKERIRQEVEQAQQMSLDHERERLRALEEEEERRQREAQDILSNKKQRLPPEPTEGTLGAVQVLVRTTNGSRLMRRFSIADKVQSIYDFVDTQLAEQEAAEGDYELATNLPVRIYNDLGQSLEEAGLTEAQIVLFMRSAN